MKAPNMPFIPLDELDVASKFAVPSTRDADVTVDMGYFYGVNLVDGSQRYVCATCDQTYQLPGQVRLHRSVHRGEIRGQVEIPEPEEPLTVAPLRFSDVRLGGALDERLALADQLLAGLLRALTAERDAAVEAVAPLREENARLALALRTSERERKTLERELSPFRKAAERLVARQNQEAQDNGQGAPQGA